MDADEIVKALKWLAKVRTYCDTHIVNCRECEFHGFCTDPDSDESIGQQAEWTKQAADLIEALETQLAEYKHELQTYQNTIVPELKAQRDASKRREKAAVEDMKHLAQYLYECELCTHFQDSLYCENNCSAHYPEADNSTDCWQWRGPQEAGEGRG